jgi:hypothetical protein
MLVISGLVAFVGTLIISIATSTGRADLAGVLLNVAERHGVLNRRGGSEGHLRRVGAHR